MTKAILIRAAHLLRREGAWTQRALARTKHGNSCGATDMEAVQWCAIGAIRWASTYVGACSPNDALDAFCRDFGGVDAAEEWNDAPHRTAEDVAAALECAAAKL